MYTHNPPEQFSLVTRAESTCVERCEPTKFEHPLPLSLATRRLPRAWAKPASARVISRHSASTIADSVGADNCAPCRPSYFNRRFEVVRTLTARGCPARRLWRTDSLNGHTPACQSYPDCIRTNGPYQRRERL